MRKIILTFLVILTVFSVKSQTHSYPITDSLTNKDYEYLKTKYHSTKKEPVALKYANSWLYKSKEEKNYAQMALAYQAVMYKREKIHRLAYTDSILNAALLTKEDEQIGAAFLTKGAVYYDLKRHTIALDNYLTADEFISKTKNEYLKYKTKYTIAQTKMYLGFYDEAIALFKECTDFFKEENDQAYLNTVHSLGLCFSKIKRYDLSNQYNRIGLDVAIESDIHEMVPYFNLSEGINQYFLKNNEAAINLLSNSLIKITENEDSTNQIVARFYLGKSYLEVNQYEKALGYFKKVDAQINEEKFFRPDLRENYEILIKYYRKKGELQKELDYVNRLLEVDSILHTNFRYLSTKMHKEYDTKKLLNKKEEIQNTLQRNKLIYVVIISALIISISILIQQHYKNRKRFRLKFEELMQNKKQSSSSKPKKEVTVDLDIAPEKIESILKRLEKFENGKKYLEKDMNVGKLADIVRTNTKYISLIIPKYRGKRTIDYISDLKIDYVVELLKEQKIYRNYTNTALAELIGFGTAQHFAIAFKARTEISPTFFIKELKKTEPV